MPYEWQRKSGNSVFLVLVYQKEMRNRKFFGFSVVKKIWPTGRIPSRFYAQDVIDFLCQVHLTCVTQSICMCFYFMNVILHRKFAPPVYFIQLLVSPSTFVTLGLQIGINITGQNQIIRRPHDVKGISLLDVYLKNNIAFPKAWKKTLHVDGF